MSDGGPPLEHVDLAAGQWTLRRPDPKHAAAALQMMTDEQIATWNPAPRVVDVESARDWLARGAEWTDRFAVWSVVDAADDLMGNCSLWGIDRDDQHVASVAYRTAPWARNQGLATAALTAMVDWGFGTLGLERIALPHSVANPASCRVADKAGFTLEGTLRADYRRTDGTRWDVHVHGILPTDPAP